MCQIFKNICFLFEDIPKGNIVGDTVLFMFIDLRALQAF